MTPAQWLSAQKGRVSATAAHFKRSRSAITQWKTAGVPVGCMREFREFTGGEVTLDDMLPMGEPRASWGTDGAPALPTPATTDLETSDA